MNISNCKAARTIKERFRFSTLSFIFILVYINVFQSLFGPENSILAVIFTIMMSASMVRDLTATPFRHLFIQAAILMWMALAAYWTVVLPSGPSFLINFATLFLILYAYTYEYSNHIYFPYILSYLFLIFLAPSEARLLPGRLLGMAAGAASMILYQWFMGRKRVAETARDVLSRMIDDICLYISFRLGQSSRQPDLSDIRHKLCRLSQTVYERRKKIFCISDASFSMIAAGRGLEHLLTLTGELPQPLSEEDKALLIRISDWLGTFRAFLHQEISEIPPLSPSDMADGKNKRAAELFYNTMSYTRDRLLHMTDPKNRTRCHRTALDLKVQLQAALDISPVRTIYALRTALLLALATLLVQTLALPHGKWLLFTLASVSLPYADDVPAKMQKRIFATIIGGLASVVIYTLVPSSSGRTIAMMLSGYISFYFSDYRDTFACSTVGALGGAVFMEAFGLSAVGGMFLIRIGYILAGAAVGYLANCLIFPYSRANATRQLWKRFKDTADLLSNVCGAGTADPQLYYHLVIQVHLLEEKLCHNANLEKWEDFPRLLSEYTAQAKSRSGNSITAPVPSPNASCPRITGSSPRRSIAKAQAGSFPRWDGRI